MSERKFVGFAAVLFAIWLAMVGGVVFVVWKVLVHFGIV